MSHTVATLNMLNDARNLIERLPAISDEIGRVKPSVLCAQEVLHDGAEVRADLMDVFERAGLTVAAVGRPTRQRSGNAILYRPDAFALVDSGVIEFGTSAAQRFGTPDGVYAVLAAVDAPNARPLIAISCHLAWGGEAGALRLDELVRIESYAAALAARHPGALVVLAGDFNETPGGAGLGYLRGDTAATPGVCWVDAWEWLRPGEPGYTQDPVTKYAASTAASVGIHDPSTLPKRRIDYIMVRGWAYASLGSRPSIAMWGHGPHGYASDHHGLALTFDV